MTPAIYAVRAQASLVDCGDCKGYIDYVTFTATRLGLAPALEWGHRYYNDGLYPEIFCHLMNPQASAETLAELHFGRPVRLPGFYTGPQLGELGFDDLDKQTLLNTAPHTLLQLAS